MPVSLYHGLLNLRTKDIVGGCGASRNFTICFGAFVAQIKSVLSGQKGVHHSATVRSAIGAEQIKPIPAWTEITVCSGNFC